MNNKSNIVSNWFSTSHHTVHLRSFHIIGNKLLNDDDDVLQLQRYIRSSAAL